MNRRFEDCMRLARSTVEKLRATSPKPELVSIFTPEKMEGERWGTKSVLAWSLGGRVLVGYDPLDPKWTIHIYLKRHADRPAGGDANPTYQVYPTSVWQKSVYDRIDSELSRAA